MSIKVSPTDITFAPEVELFPFDESSFEELQESILLAGGNIVPVVIGKDGKLRDGRRRVKACQLHSLMVNARQTTDWEEANPLQAAFALNAKQRVVSKGQLAAVAAEAASKMSRPAGKGKVTLAEAAFAASLKVDVVKQANSLYRQSPYRFMLVKAGRRPLREAYDALQLDKQAVKDLIAGNQLFASHPPAALCRPRPVQEVEAVVEPSWTEPMVDNPGDDQQVEAPADTTTSKPVKPPESPASKFVSQATRLRDNLHKLLDDAKGNIDGLEGKGNWLETLQSADNFMSSAVDAIRRDNPPDIDKE